MIHILWAKDGEVGRDLLKLPVDVSHPSSSGDRLVVELRRTIALLLCPAAIVVDTEQIADHSDQAKVHDGRLGENESNFLTKAYTTSDTEDELGTWLTIDHQCTEQGVL